MHPFGKAMATADPAKLLSRLLEEPAETPWLEFKHNNCDPDEIGRCVSACANAALLEERDRAFLVWGIENKSKRRLGTTVRLGSLRKGGESFANWISRLIEPRLMMEFLDFSPSFDSLPKRSTSVEYGKGSPRIRLSRPEKS